MIFKTILGKSQEHNKLFLKYIMIINIYYYKIIFKKY